jgi:serine/threonine protein kinase
MDQLTDRKFLESYSLGRELYSRPDKSVHVHAGRSLAIPYQEVALKYIAGPYQNSALKYIAGPSHDDSYESYLWETLPPHFNLPLYFGSFDITNPGTPLQSANVIAFESLHDSLSLSEFLLLNKKFKNICKVHKKIVFYQILLALQHLHSNDIAHMNITLDNVMVNPTNLNTKLIGLSRSVLLQTRKDLKSEDGFSNLSTNESPSNIEE